MLRRNILIFQTGGLGDFILTWPFAVALGRIYPQSRIIYVTHQQKGALARRVLRLEATDTEAGWHALFAPGGTLPAAPQALLAGAHAIYTFLPVNPTWRENVGRITHLTKCVEIDAHMPAGFELHLTDRIGDVLKDHPAERAAMQQILRSINDRGIGFRPAGGGGGGGAGGVIIHPGSGSREKCWPLQRFVELARQLKQSDRTVRFVTGEVEQERWTQADLQTLAAVAPHRACTTYAQLLEEISTADLFIGNDSGPAHLAGIVGVPTITLFGPTDPANWKPLGCRVRVLRGQPLENLQVGEVLNLATEMQSDE